MSEVVPTAPGSKRRVPRTRGALSGVLLMLLGAWGALVAFIGPYFDFAFTPASNDEWHWTAARGWYEVLPGCVAFVGGALLLISTSRAMTMLGAWLGIAAGTWFIIGPAISTQITLGSIGAPTGSSAGLRAIEVLAYFYLLGAVILFLAATAFGRLSVVTVRDVRVAERRAAEADDVAAQESAAQDSAAQDSAAHDAAARDVVMREGEERRAREAEERAAAERAAADRDAANRAAYERHAAGQPGTDAPAAGAHAYPPASDQPSGYPSAPPPPPPPSSTS